MASHKKRKKAAAKAGLTEPEMRMLELLEEMLERFRWTQVLVHAQSFLIRDRIKISDAEMDRVLEAASRAIEKDASWLRWEDGLARLRGELIDARRGIRRERKHMARERKGATPQAEATSD